MLAATIAMNQSNLIRAYRQLECQKVVWIWKVNLTGLRQTKLVYICKPANTILSHITKLPLRLLEVLDGEK